MIYIKLLFRKAKTSIFLGSNINNPGEGG